MACTLGARPVFRVAGEMTEALSHSGSSWGRVLLTKGTNRHDGQGPGRSGHCAGEKSGRRGQGISSSAVQRNVLEDQDVSCSVSAQEPWPPVSLSTGGRPGQTGSAFSILLPFTNLNLRQGTWLVTTTLSSFTCSQSNFQALRGRHSCQYCHAW